MKKQFTRIITVCIFLCYLLKSCEYYEKLTPKPIEKTAPVTTLVPSLVVTKEVSPTTRIQQTVSTTMNAYNQPTRDTQTPIPSQEIEVTQSWITLTPQPTEILPTAQATVKLLFDTNSDCQLPCWWGMIPGTSSYSDALERIGPLAVRIAISPPEIDNSFIAEFLFPIQEEGFPIYLVHHYFIRGDTIERFEIITSDNNKYSFSSILRDYGFAQEIWVHGLIDPANGNPFGMYLFYPNMGILAGFTLNAAILGQDIVLCPSSVPASILVLWNPSLKVEFNDILERSINLKQLNSEKFLFQLSDISDIDINKLLAGHCITSPKRIWPVR